MAVLRDERAKFGHQSLGELMPHALDHLEACVGNQICGLPACRKRQKRIRRAVNDQRGRRQTPDCQDLSPLARMASSCRAVPSGS